MLVLGGIVSFKDNMHVCCLELEQWVYIGEMGYGMQQFVYGVVTIECSLICSIRIELGDELMIVSCHSKEVISYHIIHGMNGLCLRVHV
jgi:hypothetical protein